MYVSIYILKHVYIRTDLFKYVPITTIPFCTYDTYLCTYLSKQVLTIRTYLPMYIHKYAYVSTYVSTYKYVLIVLT